MNQSLFDIGSAFIEAGKEVLYQAAQPAARPGTNGTAPTLLADGRQWQFILDNGPVGLSKSYLTSLARLVIRWGKGASADNPTPAHHITIHQIRSHQCEACHLSNCCGSLHHHPPPDSAQEANRA